ncbi:MAG: serine/threonine-protein phosphatase [Candidatus Delongbacteria bacterium]|nr:serine/threonine-protein phosphatase [Candidatus Delongbacteria bacterium]
MKYSTPVIPDCPERGDSIPTIRFDSSGTIIRVSPALARFYPALNADRLKPEHLELILKNPVDQPFLLKLEAMDLVLWSQYRKLDPKTYLLYCIDFKKRYEYEQTLQETCDELENSLIESEQYKDKFDEQSEKLIKTLDKLMDANEVIIQHNERITKELEMASKLQINLLPKKFPFQSHFSFGSKYQASLHLGGDFFDVDQISEHEMMIVIADVSGHGVSSSLITTMFKMVFHSYAAGNREPDHLLKRLNSELIENLDGNFITLWVALIDNRDDEVVFSNAGHPPILLLRQDGSLEFLRSNGMMMGLFEDAQFGSSRIAFHRGDKLLLYTDGVVESTNSKMELYSSQRLEAVFQNCLALNAEQCCQTIYQDVIRFTQNKPFEDDISILVIAKQ